MKLKITLEVKNKIEAYDIVSKLDFKHQVLEAEFEDKVYQFDKNDESKKVAKFLKDDFGKKPKN
jgi:hypothetical protein